MFQSVNTQNRLITAQIETVWMPEVVHKFGSVQHEGDVIFVFKRNRPWYPRIKVFLEDKELELNVQIEKFTEKEYCIKMPRGLHKLFMELKPRKEEYKGKISLKFYSMAKNRYVYYYEIELLRDEEGYRITETNLTDVNMPWS